MKGCAKSANAEGCLVSPSLVIIRRQRRSSNAASRIYECAHSNIRRCPYSRWRPAPLTCHALFASPLGASPLTQDDCIGCLVWQVGFYRELLTLGFNVFACDADAIFMNDPRPLMRQPPWKHAEMAIATDCIDLPGDAHRPLLHCDFNTGLVFMRGSSQSVLDFTEAWREKVANAKEARIRDQAAFNMLTKANPGMIPYKTDDGVEVPRVYLAARGSGSHPIRLGVLPLDRFLNGHTFFVQHVHTLPQAKPAVSVHMTYQFAEGSSFAYGKRQRLREAGLWFVDDEDYYAGKYLVSARAPASHTH